MQNTVKLVAVAVVLALGMVLSASLISKFFVRIRHEQAITVKGYAECDVVSDIGKFSCTCRARGEKLEEAYEKLQRSRAVVTAYLQRMGSAEGDIAVQTIDTTKVPKRDSQSRETNEIEFYDVAQTYTVTSTNVALVRAVSTGITELIKEGIDIDASWPRFYVSDLKDTKLALLAQATEDGHRRARTLAENSGGRVGALIAAQQGVFQITERNSTDTSGYGEYDTSTIEKTAKAVVTLEYAIETAP